MGFALAFLVCAAGVAGLFYLDRDKSQRVSKSLWLPVVWLWIIGSRPLSAWLAILLGGSGAGPGGVEAQLDGNPLDAVVFFMLLAAGLVVLAGRRKKALALLMVTLPIPIYFFYTFSSALWSPFPEVTLKRWIKDVGELVMVLVILTDADPIGALRRVYARVASILLPASVLLIRYSSFGRGYDPDGVPMNTGVTTNKNILGLVTFVLSLGAAWSFVQVLLDKRYPDRKRHLIARGTVVVFGIAVMYMAHSATAVACFCLGSLFIVATQLPFLRRRPARIYSLVVTILLSGVGLMLFGGKAVVAGALGRDATLTGRTAIWSAVIPLCPNPIIGAGFESFWNGFGSDVTQGLSKYQRGLNSAHNGYIEIYLNLGWIGLLLIGLILITGYWRGCAAFRRNPDIGGLLLAQVATATIYSITEAGFRILTPSWIFLLFATIAGGGYATGILGNRQQRRPVRELTVVQDRTESREFTAAEKLPAFHRL